MSPIKGCILGVGGGGGYEQMDPVWSLLLLLRPWMSYDYIVIQVVCWVELLEQRRLYSIFF